MNLLIDTDVLIYFLRGDKRVRPIFRLNDRFYYSYITRKELLKKLGLSDYLHSRSERPPAGSWSLKEKEAVERLLNRMRQAPVTGPVASSAEKLLKQHHHKGLQIADALIAATALELKAVLVTFNRKHYRMIEGLRLFPVESLK